MKKALFVGILIASGSVRAAAPQDAPVVYEQPRHRHRHQRSTLEKALDVQRKIHNLEEDRQKLVATMTATEQREYYREQAKFEKMQKARLAHKQRQDVERSASTARPAGPLAPVDTSHVGTAGHSIARSTHMAPARPVRPARASGPLMPVQSGRQPAAQ